MKKIIVILMVLIASLSAFASVTYEIETKYGTRTVVVPDGYTAEDVLLIVAKNYYELNEDYESLQQSAKELAETAESYISANAELRTSYDKLVSDYEILTDKLNTLSKLKPITYFVFGNVLFNFDSVIDGAELDLGLSFFESISIKMGISFRNTSKIGLSLGIGYLF